MAPWLRRTNRTTILKAPALALALVLTGACTRPPAAPDSPGSAQRLPFDGESQPSATASRSLIPSAMRLSEGTFLTVRLNKPLSSASAHSGDSFEGALDDAIVADQQTLLPRGTQVSGRVLDAQPSAGPHDPGYLRVTLVGVNAAGKIILIDTSSIFTKAAPHNDRLAADRPSATGVPALASDNVVFTPDRRLTFRLAQAVDLQ
jgi:hypothetical protein